MGLDKHPRPESPYTQEEMAMVRKNFLAAHYTPKAQAFLAKLLQVGLLGWVAFSEYRLAKKDDMIASFRPMVVRVNDVGRAEAVRVDQAYVPEEPEIKNQVTALTMRMFERNGFTLPSNLELNALYLTGNNYQEWFKEAYADLDKVAKMDGLRRVRILQCSIESIGAIKSEGGTTARVRFATDKLTPNGSIVPGGALGYEVSYRIKAGAYPDIADGVVRDRWIIRNPLGIRIYGYQVMRYMGPDVESTDVHSVDEVRLPGKTGSYAPNTDGTTSIDRPKVPEGTK